MAVGQPFPLSAAPSSPVAIAQPAVDTRVAAANSQGLPPGTRLVSACPAGGTTATKVDGQGKATLLLAAAGLEKRAAPAARWHEVDVEGQHCSGTHCSGTRPTPATMGPAR